MNKNIPKVIHYCWFGGNPLPELAIRCIESWKTYFPDYEIKEWNESNFDVNIIPYTAEAYKLKKYAFVSDYARFWILYKYGGLYFDTDVEVVKNLDDIIDKGSFFGCELAPDGKGGLMPQIAPGLGLGVYPSHPIYKLILDKYRTRHCMDWQGKINGTVVTIVTDIFKRYKDNLMLDQLDEVDDISIYPSDYFCPIIAQTGEMRMTDNTRSIHHYTATWVNKNFSFSYLIKDRSLRILSHYYGAIVWPLINLKKFYAIIKNKI